ASGPADYRPTAAACRASWQCATGRLDPDSLHLSRRHDSPITQDNLFLAMQQRMALCDIIDIGRSVDDGMHQTRHVHTNVGLHAEVPLIGLVHLGVTGACRVLGGSGSLKIVVSSRIPPRASDSFAN